MLAHAVRVSPEDGDRRRVEVSGASRAFDEDRGDDEVYAEVSVVPRATDTEVVKTNTVKGELGARPAHLCPGAVSSRRVRSRRRSGAR